MTEAQAHALIARLIAAYPQQRIEPATVTIYAEYLTPLENANIALTVVNALCANADWFPSIAQIRKDYYAEHRRQTHLRPSLHEPPLTEQQRLENLERVRELLTQIGRPINEENPA